jgi:hypothetical protein
MESQLEEALLAIRELFVSQRIDATQRTRLKELAVQGNAALNCAVRVFRKTSDTDEFLDTIAGSLFSLCLVVECGAGFAGSVSGACCACELSLLVRRITCRRRACKLSLLVRWITCRCRACERPLLVWRIFRQVLFRLAPTCCVEQRQAVHVRRVDIFSGLS